MYTSIWSKCFFPMLLFSLFCFSIDKTIAVAGEPIPGAEIYVELEPDDEPIINNPITNEEGIIWGFIPINPPPAPEPKVIKIKFKFDEKIIGNLKTNQGKTKIFGKYNFSMIVKVGSKKYEKKIDIDIKNEKDLKAMAMNTSGPYSELLSNIQYNGKVLPQFPDKKVVGFSVQLVFNSVNNYGINDEGIK